jgi:hypothetical protein
MRAALPRARGFQPGLRPDRATGQGRRYCTASHAAAPLPSARLPPLFLKPACACGRRGVHGGQGLHQAAAGAARHRVLRQGGAVQASAAADVAVRPRAAAGGAHLSTASTPAANPQATTPPLPASTKCIPTHAIANRSNAFSPRPASLAGQDEARQAADLCQSGCARARPPPTRLRPARQPRQLAGHLPPGGAALPAQDGGLAGAAPAPRARAYRHGHQDGPGAARVSQGHRALGTARWGAGLAWVAGWCQEGPRGRPGGGSSGFPHWLDGELVNLLFLCSPCIPPPTHTLHHPPTKNTHTHTRAQVLPIQLQLGRIPGPAAASWWRRARADRSAAACCRCALPTCCWRFRRHGCWLLAACAAAWSRHCCCLRCCRHAAVVPLCHSRFHLRLTALAL